MNVYIKKRNFVWQKFLIKIVILILLIFFLNFFQSEIKNNFYLISSPFINIFNKLGNNTYNFFQPFFNFNNLNKENYNLKKENEKLISKISHLQYLLMENQASKDIIENTKNDNFNIISAHIVKLDTVQDTIIIDKGLKNGIVENMPIISSQKVILGRVIKVYDNFSEVALISSKNSILNAKIQHDDPEYSIVNGIVKGRGNFSVYLDLVSPDSNVNVGDVLITSGLEGNLPEGLTIGKVIFVNKNDLKPFITANVQPLFDIKSINNVFLITNYRK